METGIDEATRFPRSSMCFVSPRKDATTAIADTPERDCRYAGTGVPQNTTVRPPIEKGVENRLHCIHCARNVRAHSPIPAHEHHDVPSMNLFPHIAITPRTPRDYRVADLCALPVANARLEGFPILD